MAFRGSAFGVDGSDDAFEAVITAFLGAAGGVWSFAGEDALADMGRLAVLGADPAFGGALAGRRSADGQGAHDAFEALVAARGGAVDGGVGAFANRSALVLTGVEILAVLRTQPGVADAITARGAAAPVGLAGLAIVGAAGPAAVDGGVGAFTPVDDTLVISVAIVRAGPALFGAGAAGGAADVEVGGQTGGAGGATLGPGAVVRGVRALADGSSRVLAGVELMAVAGAEPVSVGAVAARGATSVGGQTLLNTFAARVAAILGRIGGIADFAGFRSTAVALATVLGANPAFGLAGAARGQAGAHFDDAVFIIVAARVPAVEGGIGAFAGRCVGVLADEGGATVGSAEPLARCCVAAASARGASQGVFDTSLPGGAAHGPAGDGGVVPFAGAGGGDTDVGCAAVIGASPDARLFVAETGAREAFVGIGVDDTLHITGAARGAAVDGRVGTLAARGGLAGIARAAVIGADPAAGGRVAEAAARPAKAFVGSADLPVVTAGDTAVDEGVVFGHALLVRADFGGLAAGGEPEGEDQK